MKRLNEILPSHWSHANPIDILGDASEFQTKRIRQFVVTLTVIITSSLLDHSTIYIFESSGDCVAGEQVWIIVVSSGSDPHECLSTRIQISRINFRMEY